MDEYEDGWIMQCWLIKKMDIERSTNEKWINKRINGFVSLITMNKQ